MANKFNAKKIEYAGIKFDSKKECERYKQLKILEAKGDIKELELQKKFVLIPKQEIEYEEVLKNGKVKTKRQTIERELSYVCDFYYKDKDNNEVVEDVKGCKFGASYNVYVIKRKLMLYIHGIRIIEI